MVLLGYFLSYIWYVVNLLNVENVHSGVAVSNFDKTSVSSTSMFLLLTEACLDNIIFPMVSP